MDATADEQGLDEQTGTTVRLPTLGGSAGEAWSAELAEDILTLHNPDGRMVIMLPREEAAHHLRFRRDVLHGRTVSFVVHGGLKAHRFKCGHAALQALLAWLPRKPVAALEQEVRYHGVALVVLGTVHLLLDQWLYWAYGVVFTAVGLAGICYPRRAMYVVFGAATAVIGGVLLFVPETGLAVDGLAQGHRLLLVALGGMLLFWGIQQFALLGIDHQLHASRLVSAESRQAGAPSRIVLSVAVAAALFSAAFSAYAVVLAVLFLRQGADVADVAQGGAPRQLFNDAVLFAGLALVSGFAAAVLYLRRATPYLEAKITAQFLLVVLMLYGGGLAVNAAQGGPIAVTEGILSAGLLGLDRPYVWAPLIAAVLAFGRWFTRAVERELQQGAE